MLTKKTDPTGVMVGLLLIMSGIMVVVDPIGGAALIALLIIVATLPLYRFYIGLAAVSLPFAGAGSIGTPIGVVPLCDLAAVLAIASFGLKRSFAGRRAGADKGEVGLVRTAFILLAMVAPYFIVAFCSAVFNVGSLPTTIQRFEIVFVWVLFGVVIYKVDAVKLFIRWFVGACLVLSLAWISTPGIGSVLGSQKNPSGGFISAALIMLIISPLSNKWRLPGIAVLCGGLLSTGSRGSMLGLVAGLVLLALFSGQWKRILLPLAAAAAGVFVAFVALPSRVTDRILFQDESGDYTVDIRSVFVGDALAQFRAAPWEGVGIGNYLQLDPSLQSVKTNDPHNVFVLALAEGGYPLFVAFLIMCIGSLIWLMGKEKTHVVVLAIVLQVSTLSHAYVDVYWVRGTPVVGWLFLGAAAASAFRSDWRSSSGSSRFRTSQGYFTRAVSASDERAENGRAET